MMIKKIKIEDLRLYANDLLSKTYLQLGQRPSDKDVFNFSMILAEDLKEDFDNLTIEDIRQSFRDGIRNTDDFHITVKTYYKWIKAHRQIIWNNETIEDEYKDKRLRYRNKSGTGLNKISINKNKLLG
tara:strand:+ start:6547 stop:6930 length:384 start_codon:yes stop_codon:yes gene_type:complete